MAGGFGISLVKEKKIVLDVTVDAFDKEIRKGATANAIRVCDMCH